MTMVLRRAEVQMAPDFGKRLGDNDPGPQNVDTSPPKCCCLSEPQSGVRQEQDESVEWFPSC